MKTFGELQVGDIIWFGDGLYNIKPIGGIITDVTRCPMGRSLKIWWFDNLSGAFVISRYETNKTTANRISTDKGKAQEICLRDICRDNKVKRRNR